MNALDAFKKAKQHIEDAMSIIGRGPMTYYLEQLVCHSEALLTKYAPLVPGDRAVICKHIECKDGWMGCEKTLAIGQVGSVRETDYRDGRFVFAFEPDNQWYKNPDGEYLPSSRPHTYSLSEKYLVKVESRMP